MDESLFIKSEPDWPSGTEELSNFELSEQLATENTVEIKIEPDCVLGWTDKEGEKEILREEHKFEELNEQLADENTVEIKVEPDHLGWYDEEGGTEISMEEHELEEEASSDVSNTREDRANNAFWLYSSVHRKKITTTTQIATQLIEDAVPNSYINWNCRKANRTAFFYKTFLLQLEVYC
ncbi:uncharacterized protein [Anabrus simplex]|uniref:uncharacterized protein isoform X2 n=1 Tax=Anabrus simplex TaxID=316456 RepID=UPI0034DCE31D